MPTTMNGCEEARDRFPELLTGATAPAERRAVEDHVAGCPACSEELQSLRATWRTLASARELRAPVALRRRVVDHARRAVGAGVREVPELPGLLWEAVKGLAAPVFLGAGAALLVLLLLHLRGAAADLSLVEVVATSLLFAAALATVTGGVLRSGATREVRGTLSGALGSLGGYVVLTLLSPIPETVEFCRVSLLGDPALGITQLCLVYLGVAALYAGAPMAAAVYLWPDGARPWSAGVVEGVVFALLAAPVVVLQFGTAEWMITGTGLLGLALGAVAGGAAGSWARSRQAVPG